MTAEQDTQKDPSNFEPQSRQASKEEQSRNRTPDPVAIDLGNLETAAAIVGTAAALPFVQAVSQQAAADMYAKVRQLFGRALGREASELTSGITASSFTGGITPALHVIGDSAANTWLEMRGDPTDEALSKLADTNLEALAARDPQGRTVLVYWDTDAGEWRRYVKES
ncbi:hypothetical protein [Streptomyces sp. NPDC058665]|uniref:hypothetical protein n=1 Tax=Streptomyces sp. NPDC058665 TaxID=3346586 RepID=UPI003659ADBB